MRTNRAGKAAKPLASRQVEELAESFRLLLAQVRRGELVASTATTYRLEGAIAALRAVVGSSDDPLTTLLDNRE